MNRIEDSQQLVVQLACEQCKGRFRLRPKEGRPLRSTVPCPRCHATVAVAWPWLPGTVADPMAEPAQVAVLVRPPAAPAAGSVTPARQPNAPRYNPSSTPLGTPHSATPQPAKPSSGGGQVGAEIIQDFRRRVRDAAQLLDSPAITAVAPSPVAASSALSHDGITKPAAIPPAASLAASHAASHAASPAAANPPFQNTPIGRGPRYAPRPQDILNQINARYPQPAASPEARRPRWRIVDDPTKTPPALASQAAAPTAAPAASAPQSGLNPALDDGLDGLLADMHITDRIQATKTGNIAEAAQLDPVLLAMGYAVPAAKPSPVGDTIPLSKASPTAQELAELDADHDAIPLLPDDALLIDDSLLDEPLPGLAGFDGLSDLNGPLSSKSIPIDIDALVNLHPLADELSKPTLIAVRGTANSTSSHKRPLSGAITKTFKRNGAWLPPVSIPPSDLDADHDHLPDEDPSQEPAWSTTDQNFFAANNDHSDLDHEISPAGAHKRSSKRQGGWLWAASFALVTAAGGYAGWMFNSASPSHNTASTPDAANAAEAANLSPDVTPIAASAETSAVAPVSVPLDPSALAANTAASLGALDALSPTTPIPLGDEAGDPTADADASPSDAATAAQELLTEHRYADARALLHVARAKAPKDKTLTALLTKAIDQDPAFAPRVATLKAETDIDQIMRLGGGSTITLKLVKGDDLSAFKPLQTRRQSNYRSEIAAWRLCEMIGCDFQIPYNRPVRISRADFDKLYSKDDKKQRDYAANFKDLQWEQADGASFLYGTQKSWVPHFTKFPIEDTETWQPWLAIRDRKNSLERPLNENLRRWLRDDATSASYRPVLNEADGVTSAALARQLSDMLVFDFLVGNWDRFSTVRAYWGANCQFSSGRLVSIDNGAAFPAFPPGRVEANLLKVERFSRSMIFGLRSLDRDRTYALLFPEPGPQDAKRFEQFWKQRDRVLSRVDALIAKHGEDKVLSFE